MAELKLKFGVILLPPVDPRGYTTSNYCGCSTLLSLGFYGVLSLILGVGERERSLLITTPVPGVRIAD